ncbi:MAG: hypothetical protein JO127_17840 [Caulobacteraceae bacterium]|nr:hypothetical protein [Caulobacteraceae bacterium]
MPDGSSSDLSRYVLAPTAEEIADTKVLFYAPYAAALTEENLRKHGYVVTIQAALLRALREHGLDVTPASDPEILFGPFEFDYVFAYNILAPIEGRELLIPSIAAFRGVPFLGAPAPVRALSEDKTLAKALAASLGIEVAEHRVINPLRTTDIALPGRWILKPRNGVMSREITLIEGEADWPAALAGAAHPRNEGRDFIAEAFVPGLNLTVPVVEGFPLQAFPVYMEQGEPRNNILTATGKDGRTSDYASEPYSGPGAAEASAAAARLAGALAPFDYARFDFRFDPERGRLVFLEFNIVCAAGPANVVAKAAAARGVDYKALIGHIFTRSLRRQRLEL